MNKKQFILASIKLRFETQPCMMLNSKSKIVVIQKLKVTTIPNGF